MKEIIILNSGHEDAIRKSGVAAYSLLRDCGCVGKLLRSICFRISRRLIPLFYSPDWLNVVRDAETILLFDGDNNKFLTEKIASLYLNQRLIFFFWNPVKNEKKVIEIHPSFEVWTSDYWDAMKYGLHYGGQFIFDKEFRHPYKDNLYDLYFVGINKGRFDKLFRLKEILAHEYNLNLFFRFVDPIRRFFSKKYSPRIPYSQVIDESKKTKALLEYNQEGQQGLTLRAIEAIFLQKKLVTYNKDIVNYRFYNPQNIIVIDNDNLLGIGDFFLSPIIPYSRDTQEYYSFFSWLKRILDKEICKDRIDIVK